MSTRGPRFLYLHGFGSGPGSAKGRALAARYEARGVLLERLNLRVPSLERLRLSAMMAEVERVIGDDPNERVVVLGSSLGGLTAARVAERDARVAALVLLAPAFGLLPRWRERIGDDAWRAWEATGWRTIDDYAEKRTARIDFGFVEDLRTIESGDAPDVRVPTLIVHGVHDDTVDIDASRAFARGKRHVRLVEVDDGHELVASLDRIGDEADRFLAPFGVTAAM